MMTTGGAAAAANDLLTLAQALKDPKKLQELQEEFAKEAERNQAILDSANERLAKAAEAEVVLAQHEKDLDKRDTEVSAREVIVVDQTARLAALTGEVNQKTLELKAAQDQLVKDQKDFEVYKVLTQKELSVSEEVSKGQLAKRLKDLQDREQVVSNREQAVESAQAQISAQTDAAKSFLQVMRGK